jgi:hypothetical protein
LERPCEVTAAEIVSKSSADTSEPMVQMRATAPSAAA